MMLSEQSGTDHEATLSDTFRDEPLEVSVDSLMRKVASSARPVADATPLAEVLAGGRPEVGGYALEAVLGSGTSSTVFRATKDGRAVALKLFRRGMDRAEPVYRRFERERTVGQQASHPALVPVYDHGEHKEQAFLAMELLDGRTLEAHLDEVGRMRPDEVLAVIRPVAEALHYVHRRGLVHRDVKPANIFVVTGGSPGARLLDFGLVRFRDQDEEAPPLTLSGAVLGTPRYMPPEQMMDPRCATPRSDLYALAVCAHEMLLGASPFSGSTFRELMGAKSQAVELSDELPPRWRDALATALMPLEERRQADLPELLAALA